MTTTLNYYNVYAAEARMYAVFPVDRSLEYTALGLGGEAYELLELLAASTFHDDAFEAEVRSESGDCWWYAAAIADALDTPFSRVADFGRVEAQADQDLIYHLSRDLKTILGATKKSIRDDGGKVTAERKAKILSALTGVCMTLKAVAASYESDGFYYPERSVMEANLNKLEARKRAGTIKGDGDHR